MDARGRNVTPHVIARGFGRVPTPVRLVALMLLAQEAQRHLHGARVRVGVGEDHPLARGGLHRGRAGVLLLIAALRRRMHERDFDTADAAWGSRGQHGLGTVEGGHGELVAELDLHAIGEVVAEDGHLGASHGWTFGWRDLHDSWLCGMARVISTGGSHGVLLADGGVVHVLCLSAVHRISWRLDRCASVRRHVWPSVR